MLMAYCMLPLRCNRKFIKMRYVTLYLLLFVSTSIKAQLSTYRYWYDNNFADAAVVTSGNETINFASANTGLSKGLNTLNFQSQDAAGNWSSVITSTFSQSPNGNILNTYRYWYDNDFANPTLITSADETINFTAENTGLSKGLHTLNFQSQDASGSWSSVNTSTFSESAHGNLLKAYRYWYDNDFAGATVVISADTTINFTAENTGLSKGLHTLNFQSQDASGSWSSVNTSTFSESAHGNLLKAYRYWYDSDFSNAIMVTSSDTLINFIPNTNGLTKGLQTLNFQSKDSSGAWSSAVTQIFNLNNATINEIAYYKYWFDDDVTHAKTITAVADTGSKFIELIDVESLSNGLHRLNYQYGDKAGNWSSVYTDLFNRGAITQKIYIEPKLYINKATVVSGQTETITGGNFSSNGQVNLFVQNSTGDIIPVNGSFIYLPNGSFSYQLPIAPSMPGGEYQVYATDVNTGATSPVIKFKVNAPVTQKLWITEPLSSVSYATNSPVTIHWSDFVTATKAIGKTGLVQKKYKIEYSNDNGSTWHIIESSYVKNVQSNQTDPFNTSYQFSTAGNYIIRVTDLDDLSDFNTTSFSVSGTVDNGFSASLAWDHSIPFRTDNPVGLAADGTARIFIKLNRENTKPVTEIDASISPANSNDHSSGTELLGKIMYATNTSSYSTEANAADKTSDSKQFSPNSLSKSFAFWLVAPDDFTQDLTNQDAERTIKVTFNIFYSDNTSEQEEQIVKIVRPPLMLVHGINGDATSLENSKYPSKDGVIKYFSNDNFQNPLWVNNYRRITLDKAASYSYNAKTILDINQNESDLNTFQCQLTQMRASKYACSRVDYVCHSMGGCVARYAINFLKSYYYTTLNYGKGFINKLITLNTPHNGSYLADWVSDKYPNGLDNSLIYLIKFGTKNFDGFFV